jgi:hypothetical protein
MPNISQNVNNFLNFPAENQKLMQTGIHSTAFSPKRALTAPHILPMFLLPAE